MNKMIGITLFGFTVFSMIGCQSQTADTVTPAPAVHPQGIPTPEGVVVTPYERPDIQHQSIPAPK